MDDSYLGGLTTVPTMSKPNFNPIPLSLQLILAVFTSLFLGIVVIALYQTEKVIIISILALLVAIVALCFVKNHRQLFLWGMILTTPLNLVKNFKPIPHMGGGASFSLELVDFFIVGMFFFLIRDFLRGNRKTFHLSGMTAIWGGLILLGAIYAVTGLFSIVVSHELFRMAKCLALFLVMINELKTIKKFEAVFIALMIGFLLQGSVGVLQYLFDVNFGLQSLGEAAQENVKFTSDATLKGGEPVYRVGGLLGHPNFLSTFIVLHSCIGLAVAIGKIKLPYKIFCFSTIIVGGMALIFTLSRTGWVSFGVCVVALNLLFLLHPRLQSKYIAGRIIIIGLIVIFAFVFSGKLLKRIYSSDPGAVDFRYEFLEVSWKMIKEKPIFGFGMNTFVFHMSPFTKYGGPKGVVQHFGKALPVVHNAYLIYWVEQGTVGLILFLGLHLYVFKIGFDNMRYGENHFLSSLNLGCMAGFLGIMLDGLASFFVRHPTTGRYFWIVAGLIIAIRYYNRANFRPWVNTIERDKINMLEMAPFSP